MKFYVCLLLVVAVLWQPQVFLWYGWKC